MMFFTVLRTVVSYLIAGLVGLVCIVPCLVIASFPERIRYDNKIYYWFTNLFYKGTLFATFLPLKVEGKSNIPDEACVFVANHQSSLDVPLLGSVVDCHPHVWLFLQRFAKVPIFGFIARRMNIVVDHSGLRKLVGSIEKTLALIKEKKRHVLIFPEGGRYVDGKIHNFFYGFALIAKKTDRPVVPVMLFNVDKIYPPGSFLVHYYPLKIVIGKPFRFEETESENDFVQRVHSWFISQVSES